MTKFTDEEIEELILQMRNSSDLSKDHAAGLLYIGHRIMIQRAADIMEYLYIQTLEGPTNER